MSLIDKYIILFYNKNRDKVGGFMVAVEEKPINLIVVKRDGKKVDFDCTKVALAIKKGFDSVINNPSSEEEIGEKKIYWERYA